MGGEALVERKYELGEIDAGGKEYFLMKKQIWDCHCALVGEVHEIEDGAEEEDSEENSAEDSEK
jgi:hypothetical protein